MKENKNKLIFQDVTRRLAIYEDVTGCQEYKYFVWVDEYYNDIQNIDDRDFILNLHTRVLSEGHFEFHFFKEACLKIIEIIRKEYSTNISPHISDIMRLTAMSEEENE